VADPVWEEALSLEGDQGKDVVLEGHAPDGAPVHWRAPHSHNASLPLLSVKGVRGLQVKNFVLDGQDRLHRLAQASAPSPKLEVRDCTFTNFQKCGLALQGAGGEPDAPIRLEHLRVWPGLSADTAILFQAASGQSVQHVRLNDSRLEGPFQAAVTLDGG